jgi:acyl-CoA synthetase (AMP-forming)/AMP-acid ligase II
MTQDGFIRTGDVGYMDEDGYVYIVDRTKDMLLCGGFNVYPRVIEEAVYKHPSVEEVAVIGIKDEYRGQSPKALIKLKAGAASLTASHSQDPPRVKLRKRPGRLGLLDQLNMASALLTPSGSLSLSSRSCRSSNLIRCSWRSNLSNCSRVTSSTSIRAECLIAAVIASLVCSCFMVQKCKADWKVVANL